MNKLNIFKMLEEFSSLREEIKETQTRIEKLQKSDNQFVSDVVKGSGVNYPYLSHAVKVEGVTENSHAITEQTKVLENRLALLEKMVCEVQRIIDGVEDSEIRRIMQFRYVDGLSYGKIAKAMGIAGDGSTQFKQLKKYLRKNFL